jgi:hypothetical protein
LAKANSSGFATGGAGLNSGMREAICIAGAAFSGFATGTTTTFAVGGSVLTLTLNGGNSLTFG